MVVTNLNHMVAGERVALVADIVEFNPRMDALNTTGGVCAKLLKEVASKMLWGRVGILRDSWHNPKDAQAGNL